MRNVKRREDNPRRPHYVHPPSPRHPGGPETNDSTYENHRSRRAKALSLLDCRVDDLPERRESEDYEQVEELHCSASNITLRNKLSTTILTVADRMVKQEK